MLMPIFDSTTFINTDFGFQYNKHRCSIHLLYWIEKRNRISTKHFNKLQNTIRSNGRIIRVTLFIRGKNVDVDNRNVSITIQFEIEILSSKAPEYHYDETEHVSVVFILLSIVKMLIQLISKLKVYQTHVHVICPIWNQNMIKKKT